MSYKLIGVMVTEKKNKPKVILFNEQRLNIDDLMHCPETDTRYFGYISGIKNYNEGYIVLKWGLHRRLHNGFGCLHIWLQHQNCFKSKKICEIQNKNDNSVSALYIGADAAAGTGGGQCYPLSQRI